MSRKIISTLLALLLCCSLAVSASAESTPAHFVYDELGYLTEKEVSSLDAFARELYLETGVGIFVAYLQTDSLENYDVHALTNGITDYVILTENETHWYIHLGGRGQIIDLEAEALLRDIYDETETYAEGVMAFLEAAAEYFHEIPAVTEASTWNTDETFLYDEADLLTDTEEAALEQKLMDISHTYNAQLVIATLASMDGGDIDSFVDYLYDSKGFGYGEHHDGVLLLICMDPREYRILSNGYAGVAIGPDQIDILCSFMDTYLPGAHYNTAFGYFADQCAEMLDGYLNGYPFNFGQNLLISVLIGIAAGLIVAFVLKGQLKSVHKQYQANVYVKPGSMQVTVHNDFFLYRDVTRTKKESNNSSSSGSSRSTGGRSF